MAVLGSEPELYFLSRRHSVTGYIYTYGMMEPQPFARRMQDEMIHDIETSQPGFIIFVDDRMSWFRYPDSDLRIFRLVGFLPDQLHPGCHCRRPFVKRYRLCLGRRCGETLWRSSRQRAGSLSAHDGFARSPVKSRRGEIILTVMTASFSSPVWRKACWFAALALTGASVLLHFFSMTEVGGLWRDEIAITNIARLPSWAETFRPLPARSLSDCVSRRGAGLDGTGVGANRYRPAGAGTGHRVVFDGVLLGRQPDDGPGTAVAFPVAGRGKSRRDPVWRFDSRLRIGHGFIVLTMGLIWRFIESPNRQRGLLAGLGAVLSVQALYQNAFFLLAIGIAGAVVCLRQRRQAAALGVLAIGFFAAVSLLPYIRPVLQAQQWWIVVSQTGTSPGIVWHHLSRLTGSFLTVWIIVVALAAGFGLSRLLPGRRQQTDRDQPDLALFGAIALVLGVAGFGVFLKMTGLPTQLWYYIPGLCFAAVCCDAIASRANPIVRVGVLALAVAALFVSVSPSTFAALRWRQTNGDLIAAQVAGSAAPDDLIIVHPWYLGLTYNYYYRGAAKWTTLPPIEDYRFHRYDLIKEKLATANAIAPVLAQVETILRSGHRVWIVGEVTAPPAGAPVPPRPAGGASWTAGLVGSSLHRSLGR